jgi:L-seryl-tRNA(Ser) seleniumtransferase
MAFGREFVHRQLVSLLDEMRASLAGSEVDGVNRHSLTLEIEERLDLRLSAYIQGMTQRVINATGVVLHTNLGRAPLAKRALDRIHDVASGYCDLEYDLATGKRGRRGDGVTNLLRTLYASEAAAVVNNCAAAVLLILNTIAEHGEVIISRGELIEIGGSFRLPDVIAKSGARLRETGTTNRTRISDYRAAISSETRVIMHAHPSNYRITGFTESPALEELAGLAREADIPFFIDLGSGCTQELLNEPTIESALKSGASIISFSGDKLFGGPQAGIILGEERFLKEIQQNPLARAVRMDKLTLAALEATLEIHATGDPAREIPALASLSASKVEIGKRARRFAKRARKIDGIDAVVIDGVSAVGGGSAPQVELPTALIAISRARTSADEFEKLLRLATPPVIARISDDRLLLDLRTVPTDDEEDLFKALASV